jgi:hypothetical protein
VSRYLYFQRYQPKSESDSARVAVAAHISIAASATTVAERGTTAKRRPAVAKRRTAVVGRIPVPVIEDATPSTKIIKPFIDTSLSFVNVI